MTFRERMKVGHSNAETRVLLECSKRQVNVRTDHSICLKYTIPDFFIPHGFLGICIYLDGPPHLSSKTMDRDGEIDLLLEKRGYMVRRFAYKVPLSDARLKEICDEIQQLQQGACQE